MRRNGGMESQRNRYRNGNSLQISGLRVDTRGVGSVSPTQEALPMTTFTRSLIAVAAVVFFATPALAGPPLICFPFQTEGGSLISWGKGQGWNTPDRSYDIRKLVADTEAVLGADAPIL